MQTAATAAYGQDLIAVWEITTGIVGLLGENEPLLARGAAQAYTLGDLERSSKSQQSKRKTTNRLAHRLRVTAILEVDELYPDTVR